MGIPDIEVETIDVMTENFGYANWNLSLPNKAAPYALGIKVLDDNQDAKDLARYIQLLLESESIPLLVNEEYKTYDDLGVPYVITVDKESTETAVIKIYDRETCWHEEVH